MVDEATQSSPGDTMSKSMNFQPSVDALESRAARARRTMLMVRAVLIAVIMSLFVFYRVPAPGPRGVQPVQAFPREYSGDHFVCL